MDAPNYLIANPIYEGEPKVLKCYTYTLTSLALMLIVEAEALYGKTSGTYKYGGIECLSILEQPQTYYFSKFDNSVVIQVHESTTKDYCKAIFEIAHEALHVLMAIGQPCTNNLEEGLATVFSELMVMKHTRNMRYAIDTISKGDYYQPYLKVKELLEINKMAINMLRAVEGDLVSITPGHFKKANVTCDEELIEYLLAPFIKS